MKQKPALPGIISHGLIALLTIACGSSTPTIRSPKASESAVGSPLGPSYVLLPAPSDEDSLLGRILEEKPQAGRSLEEITKPNPCADKLGEAKKAPQAASFEDAQEISAGVSAKALLGTFGFSGDAGQASHFLYKLETTQRITRTDTTDYSRCCKEKGCGYGYVSALVYGEGEYATGSETSASVGAEVVVVSATGNIKVKVLHKRKVRGFVAALVSITDSAKGTALGPLGSVPEATIPDTVKELYGRQKLRVEGTSNEYKITDGTGASISENEFVRRFRQLTGSGELDEFESRRNTGSVVLWGGLTTLGVAVSVLALGIGTSRDSDCTTGPGGTDNCTTTVNRSIPLGAVGIAASLTGIGGLIYSIGWGRDGSGVARDLPDREAILFVNRYNRALLRKTAQDVERTYQQDTSFLRLTPYVGPTGLGLLGRF